MAGSDQLSVSRSVITSAAVRERIAVAPRADEGGRAPRNAADHSRADRPGQPVGADLTRPPPAGELGVTEGHRIGEFTAAGVGDGPDNAHSVRNHNRDPAIAAPGYGRQVQQFAVRQADDQARDRTADGAVDDGVSGSARLAVLRQKARRRGLPHRACERRGIHPTGGGRPVHACRSAPQSPCSAKARLVTLGALAANPAAGLPRPRSRRVPPQPRPTCAS